MPLVNIYLKKEVDADRLQPHASAIKTFLADALSGSAIKLTAEEISVRFLHIAGGDMIANIEIEIAAHAFEDRIKNQDTICLDVLKFVKETTGHDAKVWLKLSELGHSWSF